MQREQEATNTLFFDDRWTGNQAKPFELLVKVTDKFVTVTLRFRDMLGAASIDLSQICPLDLLKRLMQILGRFSPLRIDGF